MHYVGTRNTAGNGSAIITASTGNRLRFGRFAQLQLNAAGPQTVEILFGTATVIYSATLQNAGDGVIVENLEPQFSAGTAPLYVSLSGSAAVGYVLDIHEVPA